ncbi:putative cell division control protein [Clavispora lusitaniae]|uniref:Rho family guanine nucleotide exchange factor n=2 Tax=Clavispora lusitaniae TaxID=36911 RepID=A0AA91PYV6_CLALS|nr:RhoGEF domain family protein [Clavispora lusitaniae]OVF08002.1 putative Rho family guanine nucleotide exchange factor [Clavispora lusitaniae]QFZ25781.1 putative cell division control protein [Clavispora lusitaniae]QFZ30916.1 putative cell division control protein [Clavispora lusitaniae]QFZ36584.1 putative cell division control protein [Clavispora lusitaniae]
MEGNHQFRSFSAASSVSLNSSSNNVSRVPSGPLLQPNSFMNKVSSVQDHMFYQCSTLLNRLKKIKDIEPFMASAYSAAEKCAEQQALAFSQSLQNQESSAGFRASVGSGGFSIYSDNSGTSQSNANPSSINSIFTFTAGVLPANLNVDPATQLWKLFQQGAPLCLVFNSIRPEHAIPISSSTEDLRMCKKAVYDFLIAVKTHLNFDDDFMFTISNVFSDNTHDLLKIVKVVERLLDMDDSKSDLTVENLASDIAEVKITDERSKVFRELLQTERKYISDLELLMRYRNELQNAEALSSEQLHVLFPNLNDIVDFHRRLLCGLECNINIEPKYQRIGSIFIHASNGPFKAYEPWTIGQVAAIELINREAPNLKRSSSLLDPGFELQSYIIKPIQRLCKYPLLLKELIKAYADSTDSPCYNELIMANSAMKEVANQVNEAQRRAENVGYLQNLVDRVKNWRGFNLREQGELLYHSVVSVKDGDGEKEYVAYLFDKIIFFFVEANVSDPKHKEKKKRDILSSRKKAGSLSGSSANLLESLNNAKEKSILELKGRVYISEIYNISSANANGHTLIISWSGKKESGSFTLRFKSEEARNQWETCLRHLKTHEMNNQIRRRLRDSHGSWSTYDSYDVTAPYSSTSPVSHSIQESTVSQPIAESPNHRSPSYQRHNSSSSNFSMMKMSRNKNENTSRISSSSITMTTNNSDTSTSSVSSLSSIKIKLIYNVIELSEPIYVSSSVSFPELKLKISSFIASSGEVHDDIVINKFKYKDEDGDFVMMASSDDWSLAVDMVDELATSEDTGRLLTIWVS